MPHPGSNSFDRDRARERKRIENEGGNDSNANELAKERLLDSDKHRPVASAEADDRARGPLGER